MHSKCGGANDQPRSRGKWAACSHYASNRQNADSRAAWPSTNINNKQLVAWWARQGLNLWPLPCEGSALPLSYAPTPLRWKPAKRLGKRVARASKASRGQTSPGSTKKFGKNSMAKASVGRTGRCRRYHAAAR
jgi:hypothetical protein